MSSSNRAKRRRVDAATPLPPLTEQSNNPAAVADSPGTVMTNAANGTTQNQLTDCSEGKAVKRYWDRFERWKQFADKFNNLDGEAFLAATKTVRGPTLEEMEYYSHMDQATQKAIDLLREFPAFHDMKDKKLQRYQTQMKELQQQLGQNNESDSNIQNQISECDEDIRENRQAYKREIEYCKSQLRHATDHFYKVAERSEKIQERLDKHKALSNENWQLTMKLKHSSSRRGMRQPQPVVYGSTATHDQKVDNEVTYLVGMLSGDLRNELLQFHAFITTTLVEKCKSDGNDESNIPNSIIAINKWESGSRNELDTGVKHGLPSPQETKNDSTDASTGMETTTHHPYLQAIVSKIVEILNRHDRDEDQAHRTVLHEQTSQVPAEKDNKIRRVDNMVHQEQAYQGVWLPAAIERCIEIKPTHLDKKQFTKFLRMAEAQVTGHLAKRLLFYFDFCAVGIDDECYGIVLTMDTFFVVKASMKDLGTCDASCTFLKSYEMEPFSSSDGFLRLAASLVTSGGHKKDIMITVFSKVQAADNHQQGIDLSIGDWLGSGGFGHVVRIADDNGSIGQNEAGSNDHFMKIPRFPHLWKDLKDEGELLRRLNDNQDSRYASVASAIPVFVDMATYKVNIRNELSTIECLRMSGIVGLPLQKMPEGLWNSFCPTIINKISDALDYAHSKTIFHCDVRPSNIVFKPANAGETEPLRIMLIDWGCGVFTAGERKSKLQGFVGSLLYAHDTVFGKFDKKKVWNPKPEYDFASLLYTCCYMVAGKRVGWDQHFFMAQPKIESEQLHVRRNECCKVLFGSNEPFFGRRFQLDEFAANFREEAVRVRDGCEKDRQGNLKVAA